MEVTANPSDWISKSKDFNGTRCAANDVKPPLRLLWRTKPLGAMIQWDCVVVSHGSIVVTTRTGQVAAYDMKGTLKWQVAPGKNRKLMFVVKTPYIIGNRVLVLREGFIHAYDLQTGNTLWQLDGDLQRLKKTRNEIWDGDQEFGGGLCANPTDEHFVVASSSCVFQLVDIQHGRRIEIYNVPIRSISPAGDCVIGEEGTAHKSFDPHSKTTVTLETGAIEFYTVSRIDETIIFKADKYIASINIRTGRANWRREFRSEGHVATDGRQIFVKDYSKFASLDLHSGALLWEVRQPDAYSRHEFTCTPNYLYITSDRKLELLNSSSGALIQSLPIDGSYRLGDPVIAGKHLFVTDEKTIFCYEGA